MPPILGTALALATLCAGYAPRSLRATVFSRSLRAGAIIADADLCSPERASFSPYSKTGISAGDRPEPAMRFGHGYDIHRMASRAEAGQPIVAGAAPLYGTRSSLLSVRR